MGGVKPFIETYTGGTFCPLEPVFADIRIADIAHALSHQGRFSGHTRYFYSVAEHSVRVSERLRSRGFSPPVQLWGLLHDASEAYLVDIPTPLKMTGAFAEYRQAEARLMAAVCKRFSLPVEEPAAVRLADATLLATEVRDLMHGDRDYWRKVKARPLAERIRPWPSEVAKYEFLDRYRGLTGDER